MRNILEYKGGRWLKCDFHLHTPASRCFKDQNVTPKQWVNRCLEQQLNCVAVTDHNTGDWIDRIKLAAEGTGLTVFPGVEITCDTAKVHILALFDRDKGTTFVNDFLIKCGIDRENFADSGTCSPKSCIEIADFIHDNGGVVIPAHIDEFNGLGVISKKAISDMFDKEYVNAAQYVYSLFSLPKQIIDEDAVKAYNAFYREPNPVVGMDTIKGYYQCVQEAIKKNVCLLTFSDNPDETEPSKHNLYGIGQKYTWIKLSESPTKEGVRQAFLFPERVINCYESQYSPYKEPDLWIKSIEVRNTLLTKNPFKIEFNPQLNTIIGGRGSGKSSVFRFLRGAFGKMSDIKNLSDIKEEQEQFFKMPSSDKGVLKDNTEIITEYVREGELYRITYQKGANLKIEKFESDNYVEITDKNYAQFFLFEQYTQKQVFSISKNTNALRELIDTNSDSIKTLKSEKEKLIQEYISVKQQLKVASASRSRMESLDTEIKDLQQKINSFKSSNIAEIVKKQEQFNQRQTAMEAFFKVLQVKLEDLKLGASRFNIALDFEKFEEDHKKEIEQIVTPLLNEIKTLSSDVVGKVEGLEDKLKTIYLELQNTQFEKDKVAHNDLLVQTKKDLESRGIDEISNFQEYSKRLKVKEDERNTQKQKADSALQLENQLNEILDAIYDRSLEITNRRQNIINELSTDKVKVEVQCKADGRKFIEKFRSIIQKEKGYDGDIKIIAEKLFPLKPIDFRKEYTEIIKDLYRLRGNLQSNLGFDGYFSRMAKDLDDEQMAKLETLIPDDNIDVKYKPNGSSQFKSIVSASAGQKTTAVLTFILSQGNMPLLLDQPEDDLDNRLVCDLIVEKIRDIKNTRQIIVITHNANIPVIGDAEYIVSMDSSSRYLKIQTDGMLEKKEVKKEICEIMEGGEDAFRLRAERYKNL